MNSKVKNLKIVDETFAKNPFMAEFPRYLINSKRNLIFYCITFLIYYFYGELITQDSNIKIFNIEFSTKIIDELHIGFKLLFTYLFVVFFFNANTYIVKNRIRITGTKSEARVQQKTGAFFNGGTDFGVDSTSEEQATLYCFLDIFNKQIKNKFNEIKEEPNEIKEKYSQIKSDLNSIKGEIECIKDRIREEKYSPITGSLNKIESEINRIKIEEVVSELKNINSSLKIFNQPIYRNRLRVSLLRFEKYFLYFGKQQIYNNIIISIMFPLILATVTLFLLFTKYPWFGCSNYFITIVIIGIQVYFF